MKHTRVFEFLSILGMLLASSIAVAQSSKDTSYFPLHIGNQWSYSLPCSHRVTNKVVDTSTINGHLYYRISNGDTTVPSSHYFWYRCSNDTVFLFVLRYGPNETPVWYLRANVGDTLQSNPNYLCSGNNSILVGKEDTVLLPSMSYYHCYHFTYVNLCSDGGTDDTWLAPGVGVVKYRFEAFACEGIAILDSSLILTSINKPSEGIPISSYVVLECFPNPFNPLTTLTYRLQKSTHVSLSVFDVLGRPITALVDEFKRIGTYQVSWDAHGFASGTYFAVLRTGDLSVTKKLVLQK